MTPITSIRMLVVSRIFAGVALAIGVLGLMGYALALPALITVHSGYRGMAPLTATSIILVALSVVGLGRENPVTARLAAGLAICVAGIALVSHLVAGADVVSPWVANMIFATPAQIVGRMSYGSVLGVSLVAFSVIMRHSQSRAADLAGGAALIVSGVAVLGYAYGVSDLYALPIFNTMAVHTAIAIACLSLASLCAKSDEGWASIVASAGLGGGATRRQLTILLLPPVAGWGLLRGTLASALGPGVAMALLVIIMIVPLALLILRDGHNLDELDAERAAKLAVTDELTRVMEDRLEAQAAELTLQSQERERAEAAMYRAQRMEAIGQLTGGIAHDFNNLLAGISGSLELLQRRIEEGRMSSVDRYIATAQDSARRAAALTQRLLAFARRQTLDPRPTDVNRMIAGMADLLNRSVGPSIKVEVVQGVGVWPTLLDVGQLENALLNLCINARDAMAPDGGSITIETANKWLDDRAARQRDMEPGQYVSLCVTDTGTGMLPDVIAKVFDPFFTTKPLGLGTGLGLSMVYGFVRQSGGQVRIYSEVGKGTTMCLYLPRYIGEMEDEDDVEETYVDSGAGETVLVIDDEPAVRMLVTEILGENGYRILEAEDGPSGLKLLQSDIRIDLLVTDVGLPGGLNGRQVADAARVKRPALKVLFITGFAENAAVGNGHLEPGMSVLTKPFPMAAIVNKVRELIDK